MKKSYKILSIASILGLTAALSGRQLLDQKSGTSESNKTNEQKSANKFIYPAKLKQYSRFIGSRADIKE
nr:hypothetical protein [Bacillus pumilus]